MDAARRLFSRKDRIPEPEPEPMPLLSPAEIHQMRTEAYQDIHAGPLRTGTLTEFKNTPQGVKAEKSIRDVGEAVAVRAAADPDYLHAVEVINKHYADYYQAKAGICTREQYIDHVREEKQKAHLDLKHVQSQEEFEDARGRRDYYANLEQQALAYNDAWGAQLVQARTRAYLKALSEVREMGPPEGGGIALHPDSEEPPAAAMRKAAAYFPRTWLAASDAHDKPLLVKSAARGQYQFESPHATGQGQAEQVGTMLLTAHQFGGSDQGVSIATHEFAHRAGFMQPKIVEVEQVFLTRRTTNRRGKVEKLTQIVGDEPGAVAWEDDFADHYMGRWYPGGAREVFTTGVEAVFHGRFGGLHGANGYKADREHRNLVLGILATF